MTKTVTLTWLINGAPFKHSTPKSRKLGLVAQTILNKTGNSSRPAADWQVRDRNGVLLETNRPIADFQFNAGTRLFLSLAVGAGGTGKTPVKTAIIVDPMGHGFGTVTPKDEIRDHTEYYQDLLERPLKVHAPQSPLQIETGTDLVIYDYGGMGLGNDLGLRNAQHVIKWAEDNPNSLVVVVSSFTYGNFVRYELEDRGLLDIPNITCAHTYRTFGSPDKEFPEGGIPEWWKAGLK